MSDRRTLPFKSARRLAFLPCLTLWLAGCTAGPDFVPPKADAPADWSATSRASPAGGASHPVDRPFADGAHWWTVFGDPVLTDLVGRALEQNLDIQTAAVRIREARAQRDITAAQGLPSLTLDSSYTRERISRKGIASSVGGGGGTGSGGSGGSGGGSSGGGASGLAFPGALLKPFDIFQWAFDASWEIDLFGGIRRGVEAAEADTESQIANRNNALVSVGAEVARTYLDLRGAQEEIRITERNLEAERDIRGLTESRARSGLAPELDATNAGAEVATTESQLPALRTRAAQDVNGLSLLLAMPPGSLADTVGTARPLPPVPPTVPVGLPGDLLRRRPDIRASEAALHAETARIGVAAAQLFPSLSLTGSYGLQGTRFRDLKDWAARFYSIGPALSIPIFEGGRLTANVALSNAQAEEALLDYRRTVLSAFNDADNALIAYGQDQSRAASLERAVSLDRDALAFARSRYVQGITDFLAVLDAERNLLQAENGLADATVAVTTDLVSLYKALGGGWDAAAKAAGPDPNPRPS
jgi:NodT family efflux transporter outer membrane factor (OMF) lipoprotein